MSNFVNDKDEILQKSEASALSKRINPIKYEILDQDIMKFVDKIEEKKRCDGCFTN